jgi:hypothetical protein
MVLQEVPKLGVSPRGDAPARLLDLGKGPGARGGTAKPLLQEADHHLPKGFALLSGLELKAAVKGVGKIQGGAHTAILAQILYLARVALEAWGFPYQKLAKA